MEEQIYKILDTYRKAFEMLYGKIEELEKSKAADAQRIQELESTLYDEIINPTKAYIDETNRNARFDDFTSKYGEKLGAFNDSLKALEGDDFDLTKAAFDKYDSLDEDMRPEADLFVDAIVEKVGNQITTLKEKLGIPADAEVTVTQDENGETTVEADGEVVATDSGEEPEANDTNNEDEVPSEDEEALEDNPEEVAAFEEELKNYK